MKVYITGKNGYIAVNLCRYLNQMGIEAKTVDVRQNVTEDIFDRADCVVHCAAIVHKKEKKYVSIYEDVNYRLTVKLAQIAKKSGVKHFIFLSTMSVYGKKSGEININTPLKPDTLYGKTKLKAENALTDMACNGFDVTVLRPPMVYGSGCKGNYRLLRRARLPIFPTTHNKRSMIYIDNLTNCIYEVIKCGITGIVLPQNEAYTDTGEMVRLINKAYNKNVKLIPCPFLKKTPFEIVNRIFGDLYYNKAIAFSRDVLSFESTIERTENGS